MNKGTKILVVDDMPEMIDILGEILKQYTVMAAITGEKALKIAKGENAPDLILLDIIMPEMDGYEVCRRLKKDEKTKGIPVIFVSSLSESTDEEKGLELGALDYITKPFKPSLVKSRVKNHLDLKLHQDKLEELVEERTREIVIRLVQATEFRDADTGAHIKRIQEYTILLAKKLGIPSEEAEQIGLASTMHDIGKIGIPDNVLLKKGKLNDEEWAVMKTHTEIGEKNLRNSSSRLLETARLIAFTHHEHWDGSGYPSGLKGEMIPLVGRIVCLADVFDALLSRRSYKESFSLDKALNIIEKSKGIQFDPEITRVFFDSIDEIKSIYKRYSESADTQKENE